MQIDATPRSYSLGYTLCRHAVQSAREQCMMVADLSKDWRHAKNPSMRDMDSKVGRRVVELVRSTAHPHSSSSWLRYAITCMTTG